MVVRGPRRFPPLILIIHLEYWCWLIEIDFSWSFDQPAPSSGLLFSCSPFSPSTTWHQRKLGEGWLKVRAISLIIEYGTLPNKKKRENVGFFPKSGTSLPLPPFLEPHVCEKFWFSQKCYFLGGIMVSRSGNGWPPPWEKNSHFIPFSLIFLQNEHSGTKNKINLKWSNWSDNTSPLV